jgi:hypothetical protein
MPFHQSSSSCFLAMAFLRARSASAKLPAKLGVGVLLLLPSEPPFRLMAESRACSGAGLRPAAGRLTGGCGGVGLPLAAPLAAAGGGGGGLGAATGGGACSST